jgi:hypothetical protein
MIEQNVARVRAREEVSFEATNPSGDFIALVSSAAAAIFAFITFFQTTGGVAIKGYETPYGAVIMVAGAACFVFAGVVMISRFINPKSWLARNPGWAYFAASSAIIIMSVMAMVLGYHGYMKEAGPVVTMATGFFCGVAGMLKF